MRSCLGVQMTVLGAVTTQQSAAVSHPSLSTLKTTQHANTLERINHDSQSHRLSRYDRQALLAVDLVAASCSAAVVSLAGQASPALAVFLSPCWVVSLLIYRGYDQRLPHRGFGSTRRILEAAGALAAAAVLLCSLVVSRNSLNPIVTAIIFTAIGTAGGRAIVTNRAKALHRAAGGDRVIVVGPAPSIAGLMESIRRDRRNDMAIVGVCVTQPADEQTLSSIPVSLIESLDDLPTAANTLGCHTVVVTPSPDLDGADLRRLGWTLADQGIGLVIAPSIAEVSPERVTVTDVGGTLMLRLAPPQFDGPPRVFKEFLERAVATLILVVVAPIMLIIAALVRLTSQGPAIFRQIRVGKNGKEFICLKFRTMAKDADARRHEVAHLNERGEGLLFKIRDDPRITSIGSLLRRSSLDELPQLVNVVRGEMSLVGPRPPLPSEVAAYDDDLRRRLLVKPGLTGLWQVSGRSELTWPESIRLDLSYVDNWSPGLDARIMLRTASAVVRGTGAY